jgi:hypothetical protein
MAKRSSNGVPTTGAKPAGTALPGVSSTGTPLPAGTFAAGPIPMGMPAVPPTQNAGHLTIGMGAAEFLLTFGQTRLMFPQNQLGNAQAGVEWFITISMSPTLAQQLHEAIEKSLDNYKEQYGKIPKGDPLAIPSTKTRPKNK